MCTMIRLLLISFASFKNVFFDTILFYHQSGRCLSFDGTHRAAELQPINFADDYPDGFTISAWFKSTASDGESYYPTIFDFGEAAGQNNVILRGVQNSKVMTFEVWGDGEPLSTLDLGEVFESNQWIHFVITMHLSGDSADVSVYKNGVPHASASDFAYPAHAELVRAYIGRSTWAHPEEVGFKGMIDSFMIYPTFVSAELARAMHESTNNVVSA
jgi:hypothetical protein